MLSKNDSCKKSASIAGYLKEIKKEQVTSERRKRFYIDYGREYVPNQDIYTENDKDICPKALIFPLAAV